jgi:hypothetical protein
MIKTSMSSMKRLPPIQQNIRTQLEKFAADPKSKQLALAVNESLNERQDT